jgi:GNAT superfamily N-acetyltransferase
MGLSYRHARESDLQAVSEVYWDALLDVYRRHGFDDTRGSRTVNPFYDFCLGHEPQGFFVAEDTGGLVGAAFSWVRGRLWFLSHLFVRPSMQGRGVGGALLELSRRYGRASGADVHAVVTMAFNTVSVGLYMRSGMYPIQDIHLMSAPGPLQQDTTAGADWGALEPGAAGIEALDALDRRILGHSRELHHRFFMNLPGTTCRVLYNGPQAAAYVYIHADGRIGPACALEGLPFEEVIAAAGRSNVGSGGLSLMVPASNRSALQAALSGGFNIILPYVLLSSRPFGTWERYLFHSPGLM